MNIRLYLNPQSRTTSLTLQQTLRGVAEAFKSYQALSHKYLKGELTDKPQLSKYRKKGGMGVITYQKFALKLENGQVKVPLVRKVKAAFKVDSFILDFPSNLEFKEIREIRILPRNFCFYVEWVYELKADRPQLDQAKVIGIDHGVDNWLNCVSNVGTSFIIDGKHPPL
ncbi:MAG: hypothetical protein F6K18_32225 [Okeania sp. SIO2C2]|uniref:hypothetical protein n=1 Tax=Okeania sp. SIO2C2 TaxID=2607787 RepID=UPI0013B64BCC|nr:hypothetical protein [Okeania sp. SIO2C2]NEP91105.1 hypothetical protein [Okeania sp. SIO2C2]